MYEGVYSHNIHCWNGTTLYYMNMTTMEALGGQNYLYVQNYKHTSKDGQITQ